MKPTRIIAMCVIVAALGISGLHAKSLRDGTTPTEFPPASFKGKQYVDSKGCIYIRAGIDGNVTWVPRVSRKRQQVCGYKPSLSSAQIASAPVAKPAAAAPVQITVAPAASAPAKPTRAAVPRKPRTSATAPAPVVRVTATPKPVPVAVASSPAKPAVRRTARRAPEPLVFVNPPPERVASTSTPVRPVSPSTRTQRAPSKPLVFVNPRPEQAATTAGTTAGTTAAPVKPATPRTVRRKTERAAPEPLIFVNPPAGQAPTAPAVRTTVRRGSTPSRGPIQPAETYKSHGTCPNASDFSQQFINSNDRFAVRCGPQAESPVTNRRSEQSSAVETNTSAIVANARIVPLHVYEKRQNTTNIQIAKGYQNVWEDDRLNPRRSERTAAPAVIRQTEHTPTGYKSAWDDGRLNAARSTGTSAGDARTDQIWTQKLPRTLIVPAVPKSKQIVVLSSRNAEATVTRTSTRSASQAVGKPKYVRVATYSSDASAQITAKNLARRGLPMRLGTVNRSGKAYRVVLAGPFGSNEQANAALATVRGAGFSKAKISK